MINNKTEMISGEKMSKWKKEELDCAGGQGARWCFALYGTGVGTDLMSNALTIEDSWHYNGSGEQAFGGAEQWNHISINLSLCEGDEKISANITIDLKNFFEEIIKKYGLDEKRKGKK